METITINGREFVRLTDVCDILRHIRSDYPYDDTKKVVSMIANCMFYDEVMKAKTEEEREAARELPGDFVIYKDLGYTNPNGKTRIWFTGFENKKEARAKAEADARKKQEEARRKEEAEAKLKELLEDDKIFGVNLFEAGLADRVLGYFLELIAGKGAVRATLKKYVH